MPGQVRDVGYAQMTSRNIPNLCSSSFTQFFFRRTRPLKMSCPSRGTGSGATSLVWWSPDRLKTQSGSRRSRSREATTAIRLFDVLLKPTELSEIKIRVRKVLKRCVSESFLGSCCDSRPRSPLLKPQTSRFQQKHFVLEVGALLELSPIPLPGPQNFGASHVVLGLGFCCVVVLD